MQPPVDLDSGTNGVHQEVLNDADRATEPALALANLQDALRSLDDWEPDCGSQCPAAASAYTGDFSASQTRIPAKENFAATASSPEQVNNRWAGSCEGAALGMPMIPTQGDLYFSHFLSLQKEKLRGFARRF